MRSFFPRCPALAGWGESAGSPRTGPQVFLPPKQVPLITEPPSLEELAVEMLRARERKRQEGD